MCVGVGVGGVLVQSPGNWALSYRVHHARGEGEEHSSAPKVGWEQPTGSCPIGSKAETLDGGTRHHVFAALHLK